MSQIAQGAVITNFHYVRVQKQASLQSKFLSFCADSRKRQISQATTSVLLCRISCHVPVCINLLPLPSSPGRVALPSVGFRSGCCVSWFLWAGRFLVCRSCTSAQLVFPGERLFLGHCRSLDFRRRVWSRAIRLCPRVLEVSARSPVQGLLYRYEYYNSVIRIYRLTMNSIVSHHEWSCMKSWWGSEGFEVGKLGSWMLCCWVDEVGRVYIFDLCATALLKWIYVGVCNYSTKTKIKYYYRTESIYFFAL